MAIFMSHIIKCMQRKQKQKNDLVFKLLKSMNPFFSDQTQKEELRQYINNVISEKEKVESEEEHSLDTITEEEIVQQIVRAMDIKVHNGEFYEGSPNGKRVKFVDGEQKMKEEEVRREMEVRRVAEEIREQIFDIQADTFKKFRIQGEVIMKKRSHSSKSQTYQPHSERNSHSKLIRGGSSSGSTIASNYYSASSKMLPSSSKPTYSPSLLTYRHETDSKKASPTVYQSLMAKKNQAILNLSRMSKNAAEKRTGQKGVARKLFQDEESLAISRFYESNPENSSLAAMKHSKKSMMTPLKSKLSNFGLLSSGTHPKSQLRSSCMKKSSSEKVIKQSHQLDVEIFSSYLDRKMKRSESKHEWL